MAISEIRVGYSRTINLGNFESARVEASVTVDIPAGADPSEFKQNAQVELRELLEETWKSQHKERTR